MLSRTFGIGIGRLASSLFRRFRAANPLVSRHLQLHAQVRVDIRQSLLRQFLQRRLALLNEQLIGSGGCEAHTIFDGPALKINRLPSRMAEGRYRRYP
jgi:hypothetical protein